MDKPECLERLEQRFNIFLALKRLVSEKPFSEVRLAELLEEASVSRATFYRCFSGLKDIPIWYVSLVGELGTFSIGRTLTCEQGHTVGLGLLSKALPLLKGLISYWDMNYSTPPVLSHIEAMRTVLEERGVPWDTRTSYEVEVIAHACHQAVNRWIRDDMAMPVADIVDIIVEFYPPRLRKVFDTPPEAPHLLSDAMMLVGASVEPLAQRDAHAI